MCGSSVVVDRIMWPLKSNHECIYSKNKQNLAVRKYIPPYH